MVDRKDLDLLNGAFEIVRSLEILSMSVGFTGVSILVDNTDKLLEFANINGYEVVEDYVSIKDKLYLTVKAGQVEITNIYEG